MQDRVGTARGSLQLQDRLGCGKDEELDASPFGLLRDFVDDGQRSGGSAADHEAFTIPGDVLSQGERRVPGSGPEGFRWSLLPLPDVPAIDHDIVFVGRAVDLDRPEGEPSEPHRLPV